MVGRLVKLVGMDDKMLREMYRAAIRRYYKSHRIPIFFNIERKEFGVGDFGRKIVTRYLTFQDSGAFYGYLIENTPLYVSYSVADWEYPGNRNDAERGFLGAELVFDFDDDEFVQYSREDIAICTSCGDIQSVGKLLDSGLNPLFCINCGGKRTIVSLPSLSRWKRVVQEAKRLITVLEEDFDISKKYIHIDYSGNRGVHVHVNDPEFTDAARALPNISDKHARMLAMKGMRQELTNYITLSGFDGKYVGFRIEEDRLLGPSAEHGGMVGRIVDHIASILASTDDPYVLYRYLKTPALRYELSRFIKAQGTRNVARIIRRGIYDGGIATQRLRKAWEEVFTNAAQDIALPIDAQTSADIKRLIRMPNTIHGTTGLVARYIKRSELDHFNPYHNAVALPRRLLCGYDIYQR